jgi:hypothetical protein
LAAGLLLMPPAHCCKLAALPETGELSAIQRKASRLAVTDWRGTPHVLTGIRG